MQNVMWICGAELKNKAYKQAFKSKLKNKRLWTKRSFFKIFSISWLCKSFRRIFLADSKINAYEIFALKIGAKASFWAQLKFF